MSSRRKRSNSNIKSIPGGVPYHPNYYPQYGYMPPSYYNSSQEYPGYTYDQTNYIYYPVDQNGRVVGPPTRFPPIGSHIYYEHSPHSPVPARSNDGSYTHSPRKDRLSHNDDHYYHDHHHPSPPSPQHHSQTYRAHEKSKRESLPPIQRHPFASTRPMSPNDDELRFAVRDLTENGSALSVLSHHNAIKSIKHYDKLQKSYS